MPKKPKDSWLVDMIMEQRTEDDQIAAINAPAIKEHSHTVYRIISRKNGKACGSYSRACHDEFDFASVSEARNANCHDMFKNRKLYKIAKYRVTYTLIKDECD